MAKSAKKANALSFVLPVPPIFGRVIPPKDSVHGVENPPITSWRLKSVRLVVNKTQEKKLTVANVKPKKSSVAKISNAVKPIVLVGKSRGLVRKQTFANAIRTSVFVPMSATKPVLLVEPVMSP